MAKLDAYLRSIEKLGAAAAVLTSNQAVTLRFPAGDRQATQVTAHDQLVAIVREVAPPAAIDHLDHHRSARFDYTSAGTRYHVSVLARPGAWMVTLEAAATAAPHAAPHAEPGAAPPASEPYLLERGQYDGPAGEDRAPASGSLVLDELTRAARAAGATDLIVAAGAAPLHRVRGQLAALARPPLDGDQLERELGVVAPATARAAWAERGAAVFAYGDAAGRIRVTLGRDHRGPTAALRLLPHEPPRLELRVDDWLDARAGLVLIAGGPGTGKSTALAALVRALAERHRRVIALEDPIELVHPGPWISQREVGAHVPSVAAGIEAAGREAADAIAVGQATRGEAALAIVEAAAAGQLVVATILAAPALALERLLALAPVDRRDRLEKSAHAILLGTVAARGDGGYEVVRPERR